MVYFDGERREEPKKPEVTLLHLLAIIGGQDVLLREHIKLIADLRDRMDYLEIQDAKRRPEGP
jgi:hypothetical protein